MLSLYLFLALGFVGSGHCVGMCGPFVMAYTRREQNSWYSHVLYGLGRATTYALMGFFVSNFGQVLQGILGLRASILIMSGLIMIYLALGQLHLLPLKLPSVQNYRWYQKTVGVLFDSQTWYRTYPLGVVLGFIPCGLTAIALSLAVTQPIAIATLGMFIFGLGTMPAMVGFGLLIQWLKMPKLERYVSFLMILLGFLTTWLGMYGLGAVPAPPQRNLLMRLHPHQVSPDHPMPHQHQQKTMPHNQNLPQPEQPASQSPSAPSHGHHEGQHKH
jgi:sulfite exporter TauE/SafE